MTKGQKTTNLTKRLRDKTTKETKQLKGQNN